MLGENEIKTLICTAIVAIGIIVPLKLFSDPVFIWMAGAFTAIAFQSAKNA